MLAAFLTSLALAAPAEPVCHGQFAPATEEQQEQSTLVCAQAGYYELSSSGRSLVLHWSTVNSRTLDHVELAEYAGRVEVGIVERAPNGGVTDGGLNAKHRVALTAPIGDRPVIDAASGRRLVQHGPSPGERPCPRTRPASALNEQITLRKELGLRHGRALVRRMLRRKEQFTKAEQRYLAIRDVLEFDARVERYLTRHRDEHGGSTIVDRFPAKPDLLIRFTRRLRFHEANLERLAKYPRRLRVVRSEFSSDQLDELAVRIFDDATAAGGFLDGYGDAGFFVEDAAPGDGRVQVRVRTPRDDAARYFRQRYGAAVAVTIVGDRYECREVFI